MNQFDSYLSQPDGHQLPQFGLLTSPIVRDKIIKKVKFEKKNGKKLRMGKIINIFLSRAMVW